MTVQKRDYYEILGVPRDADSKTIKDAFRRLALRYHPDRCKDADAEDRFKEIAEAYAVLNDPAKRADYDTHGFPGVAGTSAEDLFGSVDLRDLFGGLGFDFGESLFDRLRRPRGRVRGANLEMRLDIPLERVCTGGEERVQLRRAGPCSDCAGSGARQGTRPRRCDACEGRGQRVETRERGNVRFQQISTCPTCAGRGQHIDHPCPGCRGSGQSVRDETLRVRIPIGIEEGMALRIPGKGQGPASGGGAPGDLYLMVHTRPDPRFVRRGKDLWREVILEVEDAVLGTTLEVPTLDGTARVRVPPGTQPDAVLRLRGKGLPSFGGEAPGSLNLRISLHVPERPDAEQRRLWERLRSLRGKAGRS